MGLIHSFSAFVLSSLVVTSSARLAPLHKHKAHQQAHRHYKHAAAEIEERQAYPPIDAPQTSVPASTTASAEALTYITPSPGASPVAVTKESQIVTSYVPQFTLCELPPVGFVSVPPPSVSASAATTSYKNYSVTIPEGNGTCTTIYEPTITMVCATTLTALVDKYTVTNCAEELTFSTEYGYVIVTPTATPAPVVSSVASSTASLSANVSHSLLPRAAPSRNSSAAITAGPSIETLTTYYLAPWQQLTAGTAPSEVDLKVCRTFENGTLECIREYQVWETSLVTESTTTVTSVNISTTIHGRSQVYVETFVANITEMLTTFSMSTTIDLEFQTKWTTTKSSTREPISTSTAAPIYQTVTVEQAS